MPAITVFVRDMSRPDYNGRMRVRVILGALLSLLPVSGSGAEGPRRVRAMSSPSKFTVPAHRRDGAKLTRIVREHFAVLAPHLVEVLKECPRSRDLVKLKATDSPHVELSRNHAGPHWMRRELRDRLIFAAAFAHAKGGYRIAVGIARRTLRVQAELWNWRLVERFGMLLRHRPKTPPATLARLARPSAEIANPRRFGCGAPHLTGGALDVLLLAKDGTPLVGFSRKFYYPTAKQYRKRFLLSKKPDAVHARLLEEVMFSAGFVRYCREAWHFESGPTLLHRTWKAAGKPGRCLGVGRGTWDPRREPADAVAADRLGGLPES